MSEKPTPKDMVAAMVAASRAAESVRDMPEPGTFARQYGDAVREDVDAETVEAFCHGAAMVNLLVQEAMLRVAMASKATAKDAGEDRGLMVYAHGSLAGVEGVAQIMARYVDDVIRTMMEGPAYERAFNGIVAQM